MFDMRRCLVLAHVVALGRLLLAADVRRTHTKKEKREENLYAHMEIRSEIATNDVQSLALII